MDDNSTTIQDQEAAKILYKLNTKLEERYKVFIEEVNKLRQEVDAKKLEKILKE